MNQLQRLEHLRDEVIPNIELEWLAFDYWQCGSYRCLAGFACHDHAFQLEGFGFHWVELQPSFGGALGYNALCRFFGLSDTECDQLFGAWFCSSVASGSSWNMVELELAGRARLLDDLIAERQA